MTILSLIKIMHLMGLIMGFGGAILADMLVLKNAILKPLDKTTVQTVKAISYIVFAGLAILWVTGAILVYLRVMEDPKVLMNQKIWAKVAIVAILTINGVAVHNFALAHLNSRIGKQLFDLENLGEVARLTFVAGISSVSWIVPFVLGVAKEFNFTVSAAVILSIYAALVLAAWSGFFALAFLVTTRAPQSEIASGMQLQTAIMPQIQLALERAQGAALQTVASAPVRVADPVHDEPVLPATVSSHDLSRKFMELRDRVVQLNYQPGRLAA